MMPNEPRPPQSFDNEIGQAISYEKGLAVKALIALALVAVLVVTRLLGL
jgi:hypothetical protein